MVWKTTHLDLDQLVKPEINIETSVTYAEDRFAVGIVGAGPKGLYALERLCCRLMDSAERTPLDIYWFNETADFGTGPNYQVDQDEYLLINYAIGNIDVWDRKSSHSYIADRPTLTQWIQSYRKVPDSASPYDFASRALVGRYLQDMLHKVTRTLASHIRIHYMQGKVHQLDPQEDERMRVHFGGQELQLDAVMLCTGHCYTNTAVYPTEGREDRYFSRPYPTNQYRRIPEGSKVGVVGLGLTFVDVCLALTEQHDAITIYPFSSSQVPIIPRPATLSRDGIGLQYMTVDWHRAMLGLRAVRQIDFEQDILPLLTAELRYAYYSVALKTSHHGRIRAYCEQLHPGLLFGWDDLFYPRVTSCGDAHLDQVALIRYFLSEAEKGVSNSPLMAAAAVWRSALPLISTLYEGGGFTPESHALFDQKWLGNLNRTAFGPPIANMRQILDLAESKVIRFDLAEDTVQISTDGRSVWTLQSGGTTVDVDYLIDARIARATMDMQQHGLYGDLYRSGLIRPMRNGEYQPGCAAMDSQGRVVSSRFASGLYFYGTCTEGYFLDNDTLSRTRNDVSCHWVQYVIKRLNTIHKNATINTHRFHSA